MANWRNRPKGDGGSGVETLFGNSGLPPPRWEDIRVPAQNRCDLSLRLPFLIMNEVQGVARSAGKEEHGGGGEGGRKWQ